MSTKRLSEQVKRNRDRFAGDFMFRLTKGEKKELVTNCDLFQSLNALYLQRDSGSAKMI